MRIIVSRCVPGGMHVAPLSRALRSAVGLVRIGGELVAMPHRTAKTGYKAPNAYGARSVFTGDTTYNDFNKVSRAP